MCVRLRVSPGFAGRVLTFISWAQVPLANRLFVFPSTSLKTLRDGGVEWP